MVDSIAGRLAGADLRAFDLRTAQGAAGQSAADPVAGVRAGAPAAADSRPGVAWQPGYAAVAKELGTPPVDATRVAELRTAIASGQYAIDPEQIASAMIRALGGGGEKA